MFNKPGCRAARLSKSFLTQNKGSKGDKYTVKTEAPSFFTPSRFLRPAALTSRRPSYSFKRYVYKGPRGWGPRGRGRPGQCGSLFHVHVEGLCLIRKLPWWGVGSGRTSPQSPASSVSRSRHRVFCQLPADGLHQCIDEGLAPRLWEAPKSRASLWHLYFQHLHGRYFPKIVPSYLIFSFQLL